MLPGQQVPIDLTDMWHEELGNFGYQPCSIQRYQYSGAMLT